MSKNNNEPFTVEFSVTPSDVMDEIAEAVDGPVWDYIDHALTVFAKYGLLTREGYRVRDHMLSEHPSVDEGQG